MSSGARWFVGIAGVMFMLMIALILIALPSYRRSERCDALYDSRLGPESYSSFMTRCERGDF